MERQKTTSQIHSNDDFSKALIESTTAYFNSTKIVSEESIPSIQKKGGEDNFSHKDPKANAGAADPAVDLRTGSGVKQSHGAKIKHTNVVTKEEAEKETEEKKEKKHKENKEEEKKEAMKEAFNLFVDGIHYVFEKVKMDGKDDNGFKSCWKGYKKQGTKIKGGKEVNNCVKAGYEPIGELMLDEKAPPGAKYERMVKHIKKGYSEDGELSKKEKGIAYATAWKEKNKMKKEEFKLSEKKLDPVGKEDNDIDNDGDHDKSDKYLLNRRKKVGKILAANKKMKEEAELQKEIEEEKK